VVIYAGCINENENRRRKTKASLKKIKSKYRNKAKYISLEISKEKN